MTEAPSTNPSPTFAPDYSRYQAERRAHWDKAYSNNKRLNMGSYYHKRMRDIYAHYIPPGQSIIELGCGDGSLLASLKPSLGVGVDFSPKMVELGKSLHPELTFINCDIHELDLDRQFDYILLSDVINDLWDVQQVFRLISKISTPQSRIILNFYSRMWELPLSAAEKLGLKTRTLPQNWLTRADVEGLLTLTEFEVVKSWQEFIFPLNIPLIASFFNKFLVRLFPFNELSLTNFIVARHKPSAHTPPDYHSVSVIIPARNEELNIPKIFERLPIIGKSTEYIFIEGHSKDATGEAIEREIQNHPEINASFYRQTGSGKGDAVRLGFAKASGDILMILDADLSVAPEDLCRFYDALVSGKGELINGVRLVYPMEKQAMQFFNIIGNKAFGMMMSWILNNKLKDTLCGTKVLWKSDYEKISQNRSYFGDFDPFGDFDLIFGAAKLGLKIQDLPLRYRERKYGSTNIQRWKHGWMLLKMVLFAARRIKFV